MALSRTQHINTLFGSGGAAHGTGAATTGSFTPSNNSLLTVLACSMGETDSGMRGSDLTITDTAGLTWTSRAVSGAPASWSYGVRIWTAPVGTGVSMTVSIDCGAFNQRGYSIRVYGHTGYDNNNPVGAVGSGSDADGNGAASLNLLGTPEEASDVLAFAHTSMSSGAGGITAGATWTELADHGIDGWFFAQTQNRTGSVSRFVDWADMNSGIGTGSSALMLAVEIRMYPLRSPQFAQIVRRRRYPL